MPVDEYFKGHGSQVLASIKEKHGDKKGTSIFYATANKHPDMKPEADRKKIQDRMPNYG
jgi:hypothetical protein